MAIYSTKCVSCKEITKKKIIPEKSGKQAKIRQCMYECKNYNCDVQRAVKQNIRKNHKRSNLKSC